MAYAEMGYLPDAFFNFLALLGWSPGNDAEMLDRKMLIECFSLEGVGKADAVFGPDKLDWFNSQYLRSASTEILREIALKELQAAGILQQEQIPDASIDDALELLKPRLRKTGDFSTVFRAFFTDDFEYETAACKKFLKDPKLKTLIGSLHDLYLEDEIFTLQSTEDTLRQLADREEVKAGLLINAVRVALTGQGVAPGLFEVMLVLGRSRTIGRLERLAAWLEQRAEDLNNPI